MANPKQRSTCPLYSIPGGRTRQAGLAGNSPDLTLMSRETTVGLDAVPDSEVTRQLADSKIAPMCVAPKPVLQSGGQCRIDESDPTVAFPTSSENLRQSTTNLQQGKTDCGQVEGVWLEAPHPTIEYAEYEGWGYSAIEIYHFFYIRGKLRGSLRCRDNCQTVTTTQEFDYDLRFPFRLLIIKMFLPFRVKALIALFKVARALVKGAQLAKILYENKDFMAEVLTILGPSLKVLEDSADLICKGTFDPEQLKEALPKYLPQGLDIA